MAEQEDQGMLEPRINQYSFTFETPEATIHYIIVDLGRQIYIWMSSAGLALDNLYLAIQTPFDPLPSVATLVPGGADDSSRGLCQRFALKLQRPVLCSSTIPSSSPMLQVIAEKRLLQELQQLGLLT